MSSIKQKKFKRLRKELQFLQSELDYIYEVLEEWHPKFDEYQREFCEKKNIDLAELNKQNSKKVDQLIPQPVKKQTGLVDFETHKQETRFKKVYKQLARKLHPDLGGNEEEFKEAVGALNDKNFEKLLDICDRHDILIEIDEEMIQALTEQIEETKKKINKEKSTYTWSIYSCEDNKNCMDNVIKKFLYQLFGYQEKTIRI